MKPYEQTDAYKKISNAIILEGYRGSQAHGTYVPQHPDAIDDNDLMAVYVAPIDQYVGVKSKDETIEIKFPPPPDEAKWDVVVYDVQKFVHLLLNQNPNGMTLLWLEKQHYTKMTDLGKLLIKNRKGFVSKKAYKHFVGYAYGQFHRMEHFDKDAKKGFQGYMGAKRKALVEKHGYDCKNAAHLIRLLKMGIELLTTGELNVMRPDNQMLIDIKYGGWTLERVKSEAERLFALSEEAFIRSSLPNEPDFEMANNICKMIVLSHNLLKGDF